MRFDNIIDFEDHLAHLSGKLELLLLRVESFVNALCFHVVSASSKAVHAKVRVVVFLLLGLDVRKVLDSRVPRVFRQGDRDLVQSVGESSNGILVSRGDLNNK